jgi:hypothetical protein
LQDARAIAKAGVGDRIVPASMGAQGLTGHVDCVTVSGAIDAAPTRFVD